VTKENALGKFSELIPCSHKSFQKQCGSTISNRARCNNASKDWYQFENIFPPKRTTRGKTMRNMFSVIWIPNKMHPRSINLVIELMQIFQEESLVLNFQIYHSKPTLVFSFTRQIPCC
jgi:hypothetical protein